MSSGPLATVYEESRSAIERQADVLDGLRGRAGTLLSASSLVTAFLGGQVLARPSLVEGAVVTPEISTAGWTAIGAFGLITVSTLFVLWPWRWRFVLSAKSLIQTIDERRADEVTTYRQLALRHEANYDSNQVKLDRLFWCFRMGVVALFVEAVAWFVELGAL